LDRLVFLIFGASTVESRQTDSGQHIRNLKFTFHSSLILGLQRVQHGEI